MSKEYVKEHLNKKKKDRENNAKSLFGPADKEVAVQWFNKVSVNKKGKSGEFERIKMCDNNAEFGHFGEGNMMYFEFIKYTMILFGIISAIEVVKIVSNYLGKGYDNPKSGIFDSISLANQPSLINSVSYITYTDKSSLGFKLTIFSDLAICVSYFLFIIIFRFRANAIAIKCQKDNITAQDYALEITNLPKKVTQDELKKIFSYFGEIVEINFSKKFGGTLEVMKTLSKIKTKISYEKVRISMHPGRSQRTLNQLLKKMESERKKLDKLEKKVINSDAKSFEDYPNLNAFVIFEYTHARDRALKYFMKAHSTSILFGCCINRHINKRLKFHNHKVPKCRIPDTPSNIYWENLEYKKKSLILRSQIATVLIIIVLIVTFLFIFILNFTSQIGVLENCPVYTRDSFIANPMLLEDKMATGCYCSSLSYVELYSSDPTINAICKKYILMSNLFTLINIGSGILIFFSNTALKAIIYRLEKFKKPKSLSQESSSYMTSLFIATVVNTALITLLIKADIFGFDFPNQVSTFFQLKSLSGESKSSNYSDFVREWYSVIGTKIIYSMLIGMVAPHLFWLIIYPLKKKLHFRNEKLAKIQKDLNKLYTPPTFKMTEHYAIILKTITVCFTFSGGIPILTPIAFVTLVLVYFIDKFFITHWARKPPAYDTRVNRRVISLLPISLMLHIGFTIWMIGCPEIFNNLNDPTVLINPQTVITGSDLYASEDKTFSDRIKLCMFHFILLIIVLVYWIFDSFLLGLIRLICCPDKSEVQVAPEDEENHDSKKKKNKKFRRPAHSYHQEFEQISFNGVVSYDMRANLEYADYVETINKDENVESATLTFLQMQTASADLNASHKKS